MWSLERDQVIQVGRLRGIEKFEGEIENFILNTFINFKPVKIFPTGLQHLISSLYQVKFILSQQVFEVSFISSHTGAQPSTPS